MKSKWVPNLRFLVLMLFMGLWLLSFPLSGARSPTLSGTELTMVWKSYLVKHSDREPELRYPYEHCFRQSAREFDLPLALMLAVARGESDFNPKARSKANAYGLMQILWPGTAKHLGINRLKELYEPCTNVQAGARYLRELLDHYRGDLHLTLAAYNYGPKRIRVGARGDAIPKGARWYSGYIYRHLQYVLRTAKATSKGKELQYDSERKLEVLVFHRPYRAEAFVTYLQTQAPKLRLDWFRHGLGRFRVVVLYRDSTELNRARKTLRKVGFRL